jgi:glycosyltransferase involved in cell wall biosynthesis
MPQNAPSTPARPELPKRGIIVGLFPDLLSVGGVQLAGRHTAAALAAFAERHRLPYRFLSLNDLTGEQLVRVDGAGFAACGFGRVKLRFVFSAMQLARRKPSFVLAAHPNLAPLAVAMRRLAPQLHVAVMTHGIEVWSPLPWLRRNALRNADLVLAPSTFTAHKLPAAQGIAENKIRWLPWALDPDFQTLALSPEKLPLPVGFPSGRIILTVGRWAANERYKGVDDLLRVLPGLIESVPALHLVAVGDGNDRPRLEEIAKQLETSHRVHFLRGLTREELAACYARCDVFALPSSGEGFGFVFLEAMAFGKPVVGSAHGGIPDLIEEAVTGFLVELGDKEKLAAALRRLLLDDRLRCALGNAARERVRNKFRFEDFETGLGEALDPFVVI